MAEMTSNGALFRIGDGGGPETFTTVGGVVSFSGFGAGSATIIDVTDLENTYKEKIAGQIDSGEISVTINADTSNPAQTQLKTDFNAGTLRNFEIRLTDSGPSVITFAGIISSLTYGVSLDDKITLEASIAVSGGYTWA